MPMIKKLCMRCGKFCWHNPKANKDEHRCTYCGHPVGGNSGTGKREYLEMICASQVNRARLGL